MLSHLNGLAVILPMASMSYIPPFAYFRAPNIRNSLTTDPKLQYHTLKKKTENLNAMPEYAAKSKFKRLCQEAPLEIQKHCMA
jgi:hypothetical protein